MYICMSKDEVYLVVRKGKMVELTYNQLTEKEKEFVDVLSEPTIRCDFKDLKG